MIITKGGKMELKNIKYRSAIFFAVVTLIMSFILGLLQLMVAKDPAFVAMYGSVKAVQVLIFSPILGLLFSYIFIVFMIFVYNMVAKKYPISWEVKK
jgi:hypothetical protein